MSIWLRTIMRTISFRFPLLLGAIRLVLNSATKIREIKNVDSLLLELHSDVALQLPVLVEQNRKMLRELELLKNEVESLKKYNETGRT
jgi:hypothetical protein